MDHPALAAALAAVQSPDAQTALAAAQVAVESMPGDARAHALLARALLRLGHLDAAATAIEHALALDPHSIPAWIEHAALARRRQDLPATREALLRLIALAPRHVAFHADLAALCERLGDVEGALAAWREAHALAPGAPPVEAGLGRCLAALGRHEQALPHLEAALRASPDSVEVLKPLTEVLVALGQVARAVDVVSRAAMRDPGSLPLARLQLKALCQARAEEPETLAMAARVASLVGGARGHEELAAEHRRIWDFEAMAREFDAALALEPDAALARWTRLLIPAHLPFPDSASEDSFIAAFRDGLPALEELASRASSDVARDMLDSTSAFYLHYAGLPLREELSRFGDIVAKLAARVAGPLPALPAEPRSGPIRVGIASAHLREHTVMKLFARLIQGLDPRTFELHLFQPQGTADAITDTLRATAASYQGGPGTLGEWARRIVARELDVLVYVDIGMDGFGTSLAALKLAPIQALLWGHPVTSGLPTMDLFLSSDAMEPAYGATHYREQLVRLPGLGATPTPPAREPKRPGDLPARTSGEVTAFMPQMLQKFDPGFDRVMARIAAASPELRFVLTPYMHRRPTRAWLRRLDAAFATAGSDLRAHLRYCAWVDQDEWLGLVRESDFGLDSFRWSGGNTSLEMFWYDTPIVTLPGALMRGRHTFAMLQTMELPELIAADADDYVRIAVNLATSPDFRAEMRGLIAERKPRLFDGSAVHAAFAECLINAATRARSGERP